MTPNADCNRVPEQRQRDCHIVSDWWPWPGDTVKLMFTIEQITALPVGFVRLADLAHSEGFPFLERMQEEWLTGGNRFDRPNEALFCTTLPIPGELPAEVGSGQLVGICGLNVDPYLSVDSVGRVRRLYVTPHYRRAGIGAALTRRVIEAANGRFVTLRLFTATPAAARFYERLGFQRITGEEHVSHAMTL